MVLSTYSWSLIKKNDLFIKVLANEGTLLRTHRCRYKRFPVCPRPQHLLRTQILCPGHKKMFLILFRNILCPQQMFPSLHSPRNIMSNNVPATMCPRLPVALVSNTCCMQGKYSSVLHSKSPRFRTWNPRNVLFEFVVCLTMFVFTFLVVWFLFLTTAGWHNRRFVGQV